MSVTHTPAKPAMPVAAAISDLRQQLIAAIGEGTDQAIRFKITSVELEMKLVLSSEVSADGRLGWGVLSFGAGAKASDAQTHTLKLTLEVAGQGNGPAPLIGGPEGNRPRTGSGD